MFVKCQISEISVCGNLKKKSRAVSKYFKVLCQQQVVIPVKYLRLIAQWTML